MSAENSIDVDGIECFDRDIRTLGREELAPHFASKSSGRILLAHLIKSVIWQAYERIKAGTEPTVQGNLRTFWYQWVKPVLSHIPDDDHAATDPYDLMLRAFVEMVLEQKLFRYADFDFTDENWENRRIGGSKPGVLVFAEKRGWIRFLVKLYEELGVSVLALGGAPSALTSEYTAYYIGKELGWGEEVKLIGIVDYDPSGDMIAGSFREQLGAVGLASSGLSSLIHPRHYSQGELDVFKYPLPERQVTKTARWLEKTGGIEGKAYGLESESMPRQRLRGLIEELVL